MRVRKRLLPRRLEDWLCFLLVVVSLPIIFIFEMIIVLPALHEPGTFWHVFTYVLAVPMITNIKGNFMACLMVDTSVDYGPLKPPRNAESHGWHYCDKCKRLVPPRSWHCSACKTCILKRDHHCFFLGCCVGHYNHRYFIMFLVYLFIGSLYALVYNSLYLWVLNADVYTNVMSLQKIVFPLLMIVNGSCMENVFLLFYSINLLATIYSIVLLIYHVPIILRGGVCYERRTGNYPYDKKNWRRNLQTVFGKEMYLVWMSPLQESDLPDDGINWPVIVRRTAKRRKQRKVK